MSQQWHVICSLTIVAEWDVYVFFSHAHLLPCDRNRGVNFLITNRGMKFRQSRFWILALESCVNKCVFLTAQFAKKSSVCRLLEVFNDCFALFYKGLFKRQDTGSVTRWWVLNLLGSIPIHNQPVWFWLLEYSWDTPMPIHTSTFWGVPIKS